MQAKSKSWIYLAGIVVIVDAFWGSIASNPQYPEYKIFESYRGIEIREYGGR